MRYTGSMDRRRFLRSTLAGAALARGAGAAGRPPNFLVILADDLGAKELGCYGHTRQRTPNLDRLARTGVQFKTCYATPICHPTRVEILTGQYGAHNQVYNFAGRRGGPEPDAPEEDIGANHVTFAEMLKARGYATAIAGKWQLSGRQPDLIYDCGFDEYCVWAYQNYLTQEDRPKYGNRERYWQPAILRDRRLIPTSIHDYGPHIFSNYMIDFMRRKKDQQFLAYYSMVLTHGPHTPTPDTVESDAEKFTAGRQNFPACVEYADKMVGRLVAALETAGLREHTIIFFTADNGTAGEGKGEPTELGARVPMIVNCPGMVKPRGASEELVDLSDILPTLAEFSGARLPAGRSIDGRSWAGYLRGDAPAPREWIFSFIADRRILRTKRYLLEDNSPLHYGRLFDCGSSRDGTGYQDVTSSDAAEVKAVKAEFDKILVSLPAPHIPTEGHPAERKPERQERKAEKKRRRRG